MIESPLGNALGNPLSISPPPTRPINPRTIYIAGSRTSLVEGVFTITDATFARVTAIGGGGGSDTGRGGGGGGLSRTPVVPVSIGENIIYSITQGSAIRTSGGTATATLKNYTITASGGDRGNGSIAVNAAGGIGSGGEVNNAGGRGMGASPPTSYGGGGGCAGITGPGGDGGASANSSVAYAGDGGGGGATAGSNNTAAGGGGFGQPGGDAVSPVNSNNQAYAIQSNTEGPQKGQSIQASGLPGEGGRFGGGGGGSNSSANAVAGGVGGFIIELW